MPTLFFSAPNDTSLYAEIEAIEELIEGASSEEELNEIEKLVGCSDFVGGNKDWLELYAYLNRLYSPLARIYLLLDEKWDELVEGTISGRR